ARGDAAGPAFAGGAEAELVGGRRVDAAKPDPGAADLHRVALANLRHAGDIGSKRKLRHQQQEGQYEFLQHERPQAKGESLGRRRDCGADLTGWPAAAPSTSCDVTLTALRAARGS